MEKVDADTGTRDAGKLPTTGSEIAKPALARHLDGDGNDQVRHAGRPLHQRIGCAVLEEICHAPGAR